MKFTPEYLDEMKREVLAYGVDALLTPESLVQLIEELERCRADSARLDWLESRPGGYEWGIQLETDVPYVKGCVFLCRNTTSGYKTAREAIDAAMRRIRP